MISETTNVLRPRRFVWMVFVLCAMSCSCASKEPRVERIDGSQAVQLPLKLESMSGMRDGESVTAAPLFTDGNDFLRMNLRIRLGPPITFVSGDYRADVAGQTSQGSVVCDSLSFLGGQNALPSVGGIFRLQDSNAHTVYRVSLSATPIARKQ